MRGNAWWAACLFLAVLPALSGCGSGEETFQPVVRDPADEELVGPPQVETLGGGGVISPLPPGEGMGLTEGEQSLAYVWADRGATVSAGAWVLDIPAGSLRWNKVVGLCSFSRMTPGLPGNLGVECAITPSDVVFAANTPAKLAFAYAKAGLGAVNPADLVLYVLDTGTGTWIPVPSTLDLENGNISTEVTADSRYALGVVTGGL